LNPSKIPLRLRIYSFVLKFFADEWDRRQGDESCLFLNADRWTRAFNGEGRPYFWIHAASAGELESLESVALALADRGVLICLTIFSPSAKNGFLRLRDQLQDKGAWVGGGLSPFEGEWKGIVARISAPRVLITAKYEAWPELWAAASLFGFPIMIVGAQVRSSLTWADRILRVVLGVRRPRLLLAAFTQAHQDALIALNWDGSQVLKIRDPRWDVILRPSRSAGRAQDLLSWAEGSCFPRPWGMIGNAWMTDFDQIPSIIRNETFAKTLWIIPHEVRGADFDAQVAFLEARGMEVVRTSDLDLKKTLNAGGQRRRCILVDEIGVLKHLYASADFVFVGGGFGRGLHNVMEPSVGGALVFAGPRGAHRFAEVEELERRGQLTIVSDDEQFSEELAARSTDPKFSDLRRNRVEGLAQMSGGTSDVLSALFGA